MTPASTACKSCVQGDGICEVLMKDEGHWVILDASMVILTFLGHTAHNWSGLQLWLERVGYNGLYVFLFLGHAGCCCEVLWNEGLRTWNGFAALGLERPYNKRCSMLGHCLLLDG